MLHRVESYEVNGACEHVDIKNETLLINTYFCLLNTMNLSFLDALTGGLGVCVGIFAIAHEDYV